jgi:hypothetical protein
MEDIIGRKHFAVAVVILEAYLDIKADMKKKMDLAGFSPELQKRILVFFGLVKYPHKEWDFDKYPLELGNLTCYLLSMLVIRIRDVENCFAELERRMKKEWDNGIMTKEEYLFHRKTNFEVKRVVERLNEKEFYTISFHNENEIIILYKHI